MDYSPISGEMEVQPGHGTRTASVICANQPGVLLGVAPGVPLIPYRATNGSVLTKDRAIGVSRALEHAVCKNGSEVVSISLGTPFGAEPLGSAVDCAYEKGVIVVAAAGQCINKVVYPGKYYRTISVGGVTRNAKVWFNYSNSIHVDVWAPAENVPRSNSCLNTNPDNPKRLIHDVCSGDGTSYSCCHVAAAAAMWPCYHGEDLDKAYNRPWQRIEAFRKLLRETGKIVEIPQIRGSRGSPMRLEGGTRVLDIRALLLAPLPDCGTLKKEKRKAVTMRF